MSERKPKVPKTTIERLSYYTRALEEILGKGVETISSELLGKMLNIKPSQIRKDLAYYGGFGKRGMGYNIKLLLKSLQSVLGVNKKWNVIIVGAGNLGCSLLQYPVFKKRGFIVKSIFDKDRQKIGKKVGNFKIRPIEEIEEYVKSEKIKIGIIAVPAESSQEVADLLCKSKIKGILNFAPTFINVQPGVRLLSVDLTTKLEVLSYYITLDEDKLWKVV